MELRHLRYFVVLCEELHFGRAARRLSISQPPLSVAIRQLEESVGARLFDRNSKEVRLTPAGKALEGSARTLLRQAEAAALEARDVAQGSAGRHTSCQKVELPLVHLRDRHRAHRNNAVGHNVELSAKP